ncbi:hypothetical protein IF2G_05541 [Cordyceps javanica]|nr:hypothetical protein IF2G_05541 [Cordyceps javanica]
MFFDPSSSELPPYQLFSDNHSNLYRCRFIRPPHRASSILCPPTRPCTACVQCLGFCGCGLDDSLTRGRACCRICHCAGVWRARTDTTKRVLSNKTLHGLCGGRDGAGDCAIGPLHLGPSSSCLIDWRFFLPLLILPACCCPSAVSKRHDPPATRHAYAMEHVWFVTTRCKYSPQ